MLLGRVIGVQGLSWRVVDPYAPMEGPREWATGAIQALENRCFAGSFSLPTAPDISRLITWRVSSLLRQCPKSGIVLLLSMSIAVLTSTNCIALPSPW